MKQALWDFKAALYDFKYEDGVILRFIEALDPGRKAKILDIGCGRGRNLGPLVRAGFQVTGVEVNPELVKANRAAGLNCLTPDELSSEAGEYDILLMSHIIEHFQPAALLEFMDQYLARLRFGGALVIATPLLTQNFFDDFDHVRPYHPEGFAMVYSGNPGMQVQYVSQHRLKLERIWFRRTPFRMKFWRSNYVKEGLRLPAFLNVFLLFLFRATGGKLGIRDGWVGIFKKA